MELTGKTALVTGGATRIGRAISLALANAGCRVAVHYHRSQQAARELVESLREAGVESAMTQADFELDPAGAARQVLEDAAQQLGDVQILVNNAAIFEPGRLLDTEEPLYDRHLAINLKAPLFLSRVFTESLGGDCGHIINIADWRASRPQADYLAYSLSKAGLVALTEALARDLGPRIQVNAVAPGAILPPPGEDTGFLRTIQERNCLHRHGEPQDVADAMLYLLRSDFVTGEVVHVNGGEHL